MGGPAQLTCEIRISNTMDFVIPIFVVPSRDIDQWLQENKVAIVILEISIGLCNFFFLFFTKKDVAPGMGIMNPKGLRESIAGKRFEMMNEFPVGNNF